MSMKALALVNGVERKDLEKACRYGRRYPEMAAAGARSAALLVSELTSTVVTMVRGVLPCCLSRYSRTIAADQSGSMWPLVIPQRENPSNNRSNNQVINMS